VGEGIRHHLLEQSCDACCNRDRRRTCDCGRNIRQDYGRNPELLPAYLASSQTPEWAVQADIAQERF
jgi:hypothetical protein